LCYYVSIDKNLKLMTKKYFPKIQINNDGSRTYCILKSKIVKFYGDINSDNVSMSNKFNVKIINVVYFRVTL